MILTTVLLKCVVLFAVSTYFASKFNIMKVKVKGKILPYSLPSVGPGADPGVQAVILQVT